MLEEAQKMIDDSVSRLGKAVGELRDLVVRHLPTLSLALLPASFSKHHNSLAQALASARYRMKASCIARCCVAVANFPLPR